MPTLIQSTAQSIVVYLQEPAGASAEGLTSTDVSVDLKKEGGSFVNKSLDPSVAATADIGGGGDGTVTVSVDGAIGNLYKVEVVVPGGTSPLSVDVSGFTVTVDLSVNAGVPVTADNTATLVAAAITAAHADVTATASGTGADSLSSSEGPTSLTGGADGDFKDLSDGFYEIDLSTIDTDTLGALHVKVSGTTISSALVSGYVVEAPTSSASTSPTTPTLVPVFGYLLDAQGAPIVGASVVVYSLAQPLVVHPGSDGLVLGSDPIITQTDSQGFFSLDLVSGIQVDFAIPSANYRRTFTVPSTSTSVFDIT